MKRHLFISLILISLIGCRKDESKPAKPVACFSFSSENKLYTGDSIVFTNCSGNSTNYNWSFGDADSSKLMSPKHVYKKSGRYIIKLFASNNISFDTLSKTIDIYGDSIQYKQINPPINLKTVRFFTPSENLMCNEKSPTPGDSITQCYLDIDMDSEMDFQIEVKHFLNTQIPGHCSSYEYDIVISALNPECTVSVKIKDWPFVKYYNNSDPITLSDFWYNARNVFLSQKGAFMSEGIILIDSYVGLKLKNRIGWLHVTPLPGNGISIIEYAINLEENRVIKAGQKY